MYKRYYDLKVWFHECLAWGFIITEHPEGISYVAKNRQNEVKGNYCFTRLDENGKTYGWIENI